MKLRINESNSYERDFEILKAIDYSPLENKLSEVVGSSIKLTANVKQYRGERPRLEFESQDIRDFCGVFGIVLKDCVLSTFGTGFFKDSDDIWGRIDLRYSHKEGGSNGMELLRYQYSEDNGWQIRVVGEDR